jgi:hypothetical protein
VRRDDPERALDIGRWLLREFHQSAALETILLLSRIGPRMLDIM